VTAMDTFFFITSKILWAFASPGSLLVMLGVGAWFASVIGRAGLSRRLCSVLAFSLIMIGFLPLGEWLIAPLENRFPANVALPASSQGVIVLGGATLPALSNAWGQTELNGAVERLTNFYYLANLYPDAQLVFSGGSGAISEQQYKEADTAQAFFEQLGMNGRAILFEGDSRNTIENVKNSKALVNTAAGENWILITSAYHMPRAVGSFCQEGWKTTPYPVDHRSRAGELLRLNIDFAENLSLLTLAMREWLGLIAYRALGHSSQLLPSSDSFCGLTQ
jgi:uncharacterized SAM-binding protein YcdF (DUF218 family)